MGSTSQNLPKEIIRLVEQFERNLEAYQSGQYNETQLRQEFIDPFFKALGWDLDNEKGYAEAYKDVIHEDAIKVGSALKAPDYCFRIGGTRKFFLEAKKPSVNLKEDISPAFQLRRYAWSAKLPLSILTDFEEFAVYDCRSKPVITDKASTARILYLTHNEYIDRWNEIASIFSRETVLKGSFDKYVESSKVKKGTAEVDNAFLKEIELWREMLAHNLALRNPKLTQRELNFAIQRIIDRIIFLRICEDRGIEEYGRLMVLLNGPNVYERLCQLFQQADEKYNSGLFHFRREKERRELPDELTLHLTIDDKPLKEIIKNLYYPDSPYEFSVLPADILGQVYEQFLGKVIRLTEGHRAVIEDKPEVKKAGGVYYTPTYIVDYIVKNTVGKLVGDKTPKQIGKIKILDPACGSGSFLIGAYQLLLDYHRDWYVKDGPEKWAKGRSPALYQGYGGDWRLTTAERKRILLNNIFGVDIDSQAVEVTKLSLLLKVLEGENEQTLLRQLKMFQERALPDLGNNIKCGNSLIGPDFYDGKQMNLFDDEERYRVNVFDWEKEFPEIMKAGGFDAVIGNPPYGAEFPESTLLHLRNKFSTFVLRGESYLVFTEQALTLLKNGGQFGYIVPDTYLNLGFTQALRDYLLQNSRLREIVSLPSRVFSGATVDTTLLFAEKADHSPGYHEQVVSVKVFNKKKSISSISQPDRTFNVTTATWQKLRTFNVSSDPTEAALVNKLVAINSKISNISNMFSGIKVYEVGKGEPPQTPHVRDTKPYTSSRKENKAFKPFFDGKHIGRYVLLWNRDNWVKYGPWLAAPRSPGNFVDGKILIRKIVGKALTATYIPETSYCNTLLHVLKIKPNVNIRYEFLLGTLNSRFIGWYFRKKFQISADDTFPQIMIRDIMEFPLPHADKARHDRMVELVEQMLSLHKQLPTAKTDHDKTILQRQIDTTDQQIDHLVYELYGLTEEEIKTVESDK
jgi:type I restriction-modification system DNA methylase subunit